MAILLLAGLIYLPIFLRSFLCPRHAHVLNVYFGVPGSGKTTFAAYLTRWALHENALIRFCRRHGNPLTRLILNSKYLKRRISVYSNVPITGAYRLDAKVDIGHYMIEDAKIIIDEAGIEYNNRNYKSFPQEAIYFYKYHRHYRVSVDVFSQSYEDMDVTLRRLAQNFYVVRRSLVPFCVVARRNRSPPWMDSTSFSYSRNSGPLSVVMVLNRSRNRRFPILRSSVSNTCRTLSARLSGSLKSSGSRSFRSTIVSSTGPLPSFPTTRSISQ